MSDLRPSSYARNNTFSDIKLVSGHDGTIYPGHRVILSTACDYIAHIMSTPRGQKLTTLNLPIPIKSLTTPQTLSDPTKILLDYIYNNQQNHYLLHNLDIKNCISFYGICASIGLKSAESILNEFIIANYCDREKCGQL
jgi:hypothetical protein